MKIKQILIKFPFLLFSLMITGCSNNTRPPHYYSETFIHTPANFPDAEALEKKAKEHVKKNENTQAIIIYSQIINSFPGYNHLYRVYTGRGIAYHKSKNYHIALNNYRKAIELYPYYVNAWVSMGLLYKHLGNLEEAELAFKQCITIMPEKKQDFQALILGLKPFSRALMSDNSLLLSYEYGEIRFFISPIFNLKIETTDNPLNPYRITADNENKIVFHLFVMDFSALPEYRFLPFKERTQRWANLEQSIFYQVSGRQAAQDEIKETEISGRKCAYIELKQNEKTFRLVFFYAKKFGMMIMLNTVKEDFDKGLTYLPAVLGMIRFKE